MEYLTMLFEMPEPIALFLQYVLMAALPTLASMLVGWLLPKAIAAWRNLKADKPNLAALLGEAAVIAVMAAEQSQLSGYITDKKDYAVAYVQNILRQQGVNIDLEAISGAVEAALWETINQYKGESLPAE